MAKEKKCEHKIWRFTPSCCRSRTCICTSCDKKTEAEIPWDIKRRLRDGDLVEIGKDGVVTKIVKKAE